MVRVERRPRRQVEIILDHIPYRPCSSQIAQHAILVAKALLTPQEPFNIFERAFQETPSETPILGYSVSWVRKLEMQGLWHKFASLLFSNLSTVSQLTVQGTTGRVS